MLDLHNICLVMLKAVYDVALHTPMRLQPKEGTERGQLDHVRQSF